VGLKSTTDIPVEWVQTMIDQLYAISKKLPKTDLMYSACLIRAEYMMDLLKAWQETNNR